MKKLIAAGLFALAIAGCHQITEDPPAPETIKTCYMDRVVLHVKWYDSVGALQKSGDCGNAEPNKIVYGCRTKILQLGDFQHDISEAEWHAYLSMVRPKDFNDKGPFAVMGHELCHGLGGEHK
jgi:hypothetical protein